MPLDPKRPIEELLEASAKARRAEFGSDPAMPNPMRARLHDEVARLNRAEEAQPRRSWLAMFWPQISIATAVAAMLVTAAVMWLGHKTDSDRPAMQLAMNAPVAQPEAAAAPEETLRSLDAASQVAAAPPSEPSSSEFAMAGASGDLADSVSTLKSAESEAPKEAPANEIEKFADVAIAPAAPAAAALAKANRDEDGLLKSPSDKAESAAPSVMSAPAQKFAARAGAASTESVKDLKTDSANLQQQFSQAARGQAFNNARARQAANILDNFQVELNGREIRVVDADGSTYTGKFQPAPQNTARRMFKQKEALPETAVGAMSTETKSAPTQTEQFFRATGFNASLKKRVVFEGNYIPLGAQNNDRAGKKFDEAQQAPARIVGTAKVPGESPVEVDAATVAR